jgi:hypothetical protein
MPVEDAKHLRRLLEGTDRKVESRLGSHWGPTFLCLPRIAQWNCIKMLGHLRILFGICAAMCAPALALHPFPGATPLGRAGLARSCCRCENLSVL